MALREDPILRRIAWHGHIAQWLPTSLPTTRIVIAIVVAAFTFAMVAIQETQTLVRLGGEIQRLHRAVGQMMRRCGPALAQPRNRQPARGPLQEPPHNHAALGMRAPDKRRFTISEDLPPGVSFDLPLWAAPTQRLHEPPWWEELVRGIGERITKLAE